MAFDTILPDGKLSDWQCNLVVTFAQTFDITYETIDGEHEHVYQTCYGLSDRVIASIIGIHRFIRLDTSQALPLSSGYCTGTLQKRSQEVIDFLQTTSQQTKKHGMRVHFDDRDLRAR